MKRQSWSFCRRLARTMFIIHHFGEWFAPTTLQMQWLISMRQRLEAFIDTLESEVKKFQLSLTRTKLSTRGFRGTFLTWHTFQLAMPFDFEVNELISYVRNFASVPTLPTTYRLGFEIGFIGKHVTYRSSGNKWKLHVSGATHLARGDDHTIFFDIEFLEKAHNHNIAHTLGHELVHAVLNVDDKGLGDMDHKFYLDNKKHLEEESLKLRQESLPFFKVFHQNVVNLINILVMREQIKLLDRIISEAYSELDFPFPPNSQMKSSVNCPFCNIPMEFVMS